MTELIIHLAIVIILTFILNIPAGYFRENYRKMSWQWFLILHSPIPLIILLRLSLDISYYYIPILVVVAVLGQWVGSRPVRKYILNNLKKSPDEERV